MYLLCFSWVTRNSSLLHHFQAAGHLLKSQGSHCLIKKSLALQSPCCCHRFCQLGNSSSSCFRHTNASKPVASRGKRKCLEHIIIMMMKVIVKRKVSSLETTVSAYICACAHLHACPHTQSHRHLHTQAFGLYKA